VSMVAFLREHRRAILALIGAVVIPMLTSVLNNIIAKALGETLTSLLIIASTLIGLAVILYVLYRLLAPRPKVRMVLDTDKPPQYKGLIAFVGTGRKVEGKRKFPESAIPAIEYHLRDAQGKPVLRICWLIATEDPRSMGMAREIQEKYQAQGVDVRIKCLHSAFDMREAYETVMEIYRSELPEGWSEKDVIADITGGTKPMTLGMVLACWPTQPMQYMTGRQEKIESYPMRIKPWES